MKGELLVLPFIYRWKDKFLLFLFLPLPLLLFVYPFLLLFTIQILKIVLHVHELIKLFVPVEKSVLLGKGHDGVFFIGDIDVRVSLGVILSLKVWRLRWGLGLNGVFSNVQLIARKMFT